MTTTDKIRRLLAQGLSAPEVAKKLKIKTGRVHTVKWLDKKTKAKQKVQVERSHDPKVIKAEQDYLRSVKQALDVIEKKPKEDPKAKEWLKDNPWFGVSKPRTAYALGLHEELVRSGVDPKSDEYYRRIDEAMSIVPGKEKKKYRMQAAFEKPAVFLESIAETREKIRDQTERELLDLVNRPPHYRTGGIETIDFIEAKDLNYRLGNVIKYVSRAGRKDTDAVQDLEKAAWYLQREITTRKNA